METQTDQASFIKVMTIFLFCMAPIIALAIGFLQKPIKDTFWILTNRFHQSVKAKITECVIYEREGTSDATDIGTDSPGWSQYFPEIKIEYIYKDKVYKSQMKLTKLGYEKPIDAFNHLLKNAPDQPVRYIQTYEKHIYSSYAQFFKEIRINENPLKCNYIDIMINPYYPCESEANHNTFSWWDWLLAGLFAFVPSFILPVYLFKLKSISQNNRINMVLMTLALSVILYFSVTKILTNWKDREINNPKSRYHYGYFQILFDHTYDGSQIEKYIEKK